MNSPETEAGKQTDLFPEFTSPYVSSLSTIKMPENTKQRRSDQMSKFKPFHEYQKPLVGVSPEAMLDYIESVIPADHLCRIVKEVVMSLDTEGIEATYCFNGQKSYHPKLMLSLLFYGYATGVRSSRKLEEKCISDHIYIYLMHCYAPDHRTISDFRKDHGKEMERYFVDIIRIMNKLGYSTVGKIYIDGTKLRGNASSKKTRDRAGYEKWLSRIREEIRTLLKETEEIDKQEDDNCATDADEEIKQKLADRTYLRSKIQEAMKKMKEEDIPKMNLTDGDANYMKGGTSKDIRPSYNCQAAVTEEGVIVAAEVIQEANDRKQLKPMIEQTETNTEEAVKEVTADSGYGSLSNYEYLQHRGIEGYVPDVYFHQYASGEYEKEENRYHYSKFHYDETADSYLCPEGKRLAYWKTRKNKTGNRQWNHKVYKGTECETCAERSLCTKSEARELLIDIREPLLQKMREKLIRGKGKSEYLKRHYTIEPIFGHLKYNVGYRNFLLRGIQKVKAEFALMCIGWNIKKMLKMCMLPEMI
jgi:transposase